MLTIERLKFKARTNMDGTSSSGQVSPSDVGGPPKTRLERLTDSLDSSIGWSSGGTS
jgi:hypothetical protein